MRTRVTQIPERHYEGQLLQGVSRSFALTIPQLPSALRSVVTVAYLWCRIADTIEDETALTVQQKRTFFCRLLGVIEGNESAQHFAETLLPLLSDGTLPDEKLLIKNTAFVMHKTSGFTHNQQIAIKRCLMIMTTGMQHFQEIKDPHGLNTLSQLDSYCYYVAGVVGEMLTELFCEYSNQISKNRQQLFELAPSFGQGLQMTNILKDLWDDSKRQDCWLPQDIFNNFGFDLMNLTSDKDSEAFESGLGRLIAITHAHLRNALTYTLIFPRYETGIRRFCLWAIGMAVLTLNNINRKRQYRSGKEVKISRRSLRGVILFTNTAIRSNLLLRCLFAVTTKGIPNIAMP